jgi:hypothetical protein
VNQIAVRLLNLAGAGRHRADPLTVPPSRYPPFEGSADETQMLPGPLTAYAQAVAANLAGRRELTAQAGQPTVVIPALSVDVTWPPRVPIAEDYRDLRVFPAVVRGACRVGLRGIGTRGAFLVAPLPDWGLDGSADAAPDAEDLGPAWDRVAEHYEAGFYNARRVFHSADTAGFPAVTA